MRPATVLGLLLATSVALATAPAIVAAEKKSQPTGTIKDLEDT